MKKIKYILEAVVVIGIALAFVMPGVAMFENKELVVIDGHTNKLLSRDGWEEQASGFWEESRGINFMDAVDENTAWAVGYDGTGGGLYETIYTKTIDGGNLWEADLIFVDDGYGLGNICGIDGNTAWAAVFSTGAQDEKCGIYKTTDGGSSWTHQFEGPYSFANNVWFFDENEGVAMGDGLDDYFEVYTSDDGGNNWTRVPEENFLGLQAEPGEAGWTGCMEAVGDTILFGSNVGNVFLSTDRGHTWTGSYSGCDVGGLNPGVNVLAFKDSTHGLAGHDNGISYDLYSTSDGGQNWAEVTPTGFVYSAGLSYVPGTNNMYISTGGAEGYSGASYSLDGGQSWTDYTEMIDIQMLACDFVEGVDQCVGWAGSFNTDEFTGGMYKYTYTPPANDPPGAPTISGPDGGKPGTSYKFTFKAVDPDDDQVKYLIDWGDGKTDTTALNPSNTNVEVSHTWSKKGTYTIKAKAQDSNDLIGPETTKTVTMPRDKTINQPIIKLLQRYPKLFDILKNIFGL